MSRDTDWDVKAAVTGGVVTVRELTHHTSQILDELTAQNQPVAVTRRGRVVATVEPTTMRRMFENTFDKSARMALIEKAEQQFKDGSFRTADDVFAVDDPA